MDSSDGTATATEKQSSSDRLNDSEKLAYRTVDAREIVGVKRAQFYRLLATGEIEFFKVGKKTMLIPRQALVDWVERQRAQSQNDIQKVEG